MIACMLNALVCRRQVISGNFATEYASKELIRLVNEEKKQKQLEEIQRWEKEFDHSLSQAPASIARYCPPPFSPPAIVVSHGECGRGNRMLSMPVTPTCTTLT